MKSFAWILCFGAGSLLLSGCGGSGGKSLAGSGEQNYLGDWIDVKNPERFAKIYRDGAALVWEDNEGKYPARLENGQLRFSADFGEIAVQHLKSSDHLIAAGLEFKRKAAK